MRIEKLGGFVEFISQKWRVNGTLSVSRAFGDVDMRPFIKCDPDLCRYRLDGMEQFLLLSSSAFYTLMEPEEVAAFISDCVNAGMNTSEITNALLTEAGNRNNQLDITSIFLI